MKQSDKTKHSLWKIIGWGFLVTFAAIGVLAVVFGAFIFISAMTGGISDEEQGVQLIKTTPEYELLAVKYGSDKVSVKAVNLHEEGQSAFLKKIDAGFKSQPGCIILLEGGNEEGYVYQLDEGFHIIHKISLTAFNEGSRNVDPQVIEHFMNSFV